MHEANIEQRPTRPRSLLEFEIPCPERAVCISSLARYPEYDQALSRMGRIAPFSSAVARDRKLVFLEQIHQS